ncbi:MAG: hypothetical protein LBC17_02930 [Lactobacillaceae bacterium]|jgi:hypothetical protein|nr:hypothetical protein [Lactobacillaceae bacterium]
MNKLYLQEVLKNKKKFQFTMIDMIPIMRKLNDECWSVLFEIFYNRNGYYDIYFFRDILNFLDDNMTGNEIVIYAAQHELPDKHALAIKNEEIWSILARQKKEIKQYQINSDINESQIYQLFNVNYVWMANAL